MRTTRAVARKRRVWRAILAATIVLTVCAGGAVVFFGSKVLRDTHTTFGNLLDRPFGGQKFVRILALGEDNTSKKRSTGRGLSDTIMVAAIDMDSKTVRAISIPRDTRVNIEGHGIQKINSAYAFGGPKLAKQAAEAVLGVKVDYFVKTDIAGLADIVDLVGGVGIDIEKNMHYTDRRGHLYINLRKGYRHLNGEKALGYVRFRHDAVGDSGYTFVDGKRVATGRIVRQQKFLRALARQLLTGDNVLRLPTLAAEMYQKKYIVTDMNLKDMQALVKLARDVPPDQMEMEAVPGAPENIDGVSYWVPDMQLTAEAAARLLQPQHSGSHSAASGSATAVTVAVLNGTGEAGVATKVADELRKSGYTVTTTSNADSFSYETSQIIVYTDNNDGAERIAQLIGCSDVRSGKSSSVERKGADITVIVGKDYKM